MPMLEPAVHHGTETTQAAACGTAHHVGIACGAIHWATMSDDLAKVTCGACRAAMGYLVEAPPTGSVVAINWGGPYQEVWVANSANIGNWYTPDIPLRGDAHPHWGDVLLRADGRTLTLLVAGDPGTYATGYDAGVTATAAAMEDAAEQARDHVSARRAQRGAPVAADA